MRRWKCETCETINDPADIGCTVCDSPRAIRSEMPPEPKKGAARIRRKAQPPIVAIPAIDHRVKFTSDVSDTKPIARRPLFHWQWIVVSVFFLCVTVGFGTAFFLPKSTPISKKPVPSLVGKMGSLFPVSNRPNVIFFYRKEGQAESQSVMCNGDSDSIVVPAGRYIVSFEDASHQQIGREQTVTVRPRTESSPPTVVTPD